MTLVEFVAPLQKASWRDKCLAVLYYFHHYQEVEAATVEDIRAGLRGARLTGWRRTNVADVLAKSGKLVDSPTVVGSRRAWKLTRTGEKHIRSVLKIPETEAEVQHDVATLAAAALRISDDDARAFMEEGIDCLRFGALRAAVVFLWAGAIRLIQGRALAMGQVALNAALKKHDPRARDVSKIDDFAYIKDKTTLLACGTLGALDKGQRTTLEEALDLRNRSGHPTRYRPGPKKVSSFIEDLMGIVFTRP